MLNFFLHIVDTELEKEKFEKLYYKYRNLMFWVANDVLKDDWLAEDAVNEAFIRICKNFHKIDEVNCSKTKNFLVVIVRNVSLSMLGKKSNEESLDNYVDCYTNVVEMDLTFSKVEYNDALRAIEALPLIYRDTLYLTLILGYTERETSELLNISQKAVGKRKERGIRILRKELGDYDD